MANQADHSRQKLALSVREVMEELSLGRNSVLTLVHSGQLRSVRVGKRIIIPRRALEDFLAGAPA